jgi:nucleotide-binding universal stress UspA family protein
MIALKNVLVATDFSESSDHALTYGRDLARTSGARLHLLHIAENLMATSVAEYYPAGFPEMQLEVEAAARTRLEALVTAEDRAQLKAVALVRTSAAPAAAIVEYAKEASIDLIVIGTHGRGMVSRLLMGSVAERVVRMAPCPVLTVHHPQHEFVLQEALVAVADNALPQGAL